MIAPLLPAPQPLLRGYQREAATVPETNACGTK